MRYREGAPREVMEGVFVSLMAWAKGRGYRWFSLGMAPLSGFERSPVAPLWSRLGSFLFEHGGPFYNFQGLRGVRRSSIRNGSRSIWSIAAGSDCRRSWPTHRR